jgi:hypothetical protein
MANPYVPTNLRVEQYFSNHIGVAWDFPAPGLTPNYTFKVYTSLVVGGPFTNLLTTTPRLSADLFNPYGLVNYYIVVTSFDINTSEESAQTLPIFLSVDHTSDGVGGAVAKSGTNVPKFFRTNELGQLELAGGAISVTTSAGTPFNDFWFTAAPLATMVATLVQTTATPGPESSYVTGLYVTGQGRCLIELKRAGILVWRGRTNDVDTDLNPLFSNGEIVASPGQALEIYVSNDNATPLDFAGNLFGFRK